MNNASLPCWGRAILLCLALVPPLAQAQVRPLNDTGINFCRDHATGVDTPCDPNNAAHKGQDGLIGRDAAAASPGSGFTKTGGGGQGFDFTKISNSGNPLPPGAALGAGADDWACTRDNVTGLIWEIKTTSGLRSQNHTYTWYNSDPLTNRGNNGSASGGTCFSAGHCDTEKFVVGVNSATLCGKNDWRMPSFHELQSIADMSRNNPAIDPTYFPNTTSSYFWSGSPYAGDLNGAWYVNFYYGYAYGCAYPCDSDRGNDYFVRLVRAGQ